MPKPESLADRAANSRLRECFDGTRTHLRIGSWQSLGNCEITVIGSVWDLHGTVCTCCKRLKHTSAALDADDSP
jgi:hypothetical protein